MNAPIANNPSLREQILAAAIRQGPTFLVLILILAGIWQGGSFLAREGLPKALDQIKAGYLDIQTAHDANLREVIGAFERDQARDASTVKLLAEAVEHRDLLKRTHDLVERLSEQVSDRFSPSNPHPHHEGGK